MLGVLLIVAALAIYLYWSSNALQTTHYTIDASAEMRIVLLSDLHGKHFGKNNTRLYNTVAAQSPDIICIAGDLVSRDRKNAEEACEFASNLTKLCPVYYVAGNHEHGSGVYGKIIEMLNDGGVRTLENEIAVEGQGDEAVIIAGADENADGLNSMLDELKAMEGCKVMLNHYPHTAERYKGSALAILSGHAHGGLVRIPFIGGLIAPQQGFFPKYTEGTHVFDSTTLVISRGLGDSLIPVRIFNRPEIVVVDLIKF